MKRYIKSAIQPYVTLKDWINTNKGKLDDSTFIVVHDMQRYRGTSDIGGIMFEGTFAELSAGILTTGADKNSINWFAYDCAGSSTQSYYEILSHYELESVEEMTYGLEIEVYNDLDM